MGPLRYTPIRAGAGLMLLAALAAGPVAAQNATAVDSRSGSVRIYVSLATSAMTRLVAAVNKHFPNLKIDFVRAGSVETVKRFVAERQAGRIGAISSMAPTRAVSSISRKKAGSIPAWRRRN